MDRKNQVIYPLCRNCHATHGMSIRNMETGDIEPLDICYDCLFKENDKMPQGKVYVIASDLKHQYMANQLENTLQYLMKKLK